MIGKDTVMTAKQVGIAKFPILKSAQGVIWEEYFREDDKRVLQAQAELSFKAGTKEVVEWVRYVGLKGNDPLGRLLIGGKEWQAKLKEWGLE